MVFFLVFEAIWRCKFTNYSANNKRKNTFSFLSWAEESENAARGDCQRRTRGLPTPHAEIESPHAAFLHFEFYNFEF